MCLSQKFLKLWNLCAITRCGRVKLKRAQTQLFKQRSRLSYVICERFSINLFNWFSEWCASTGEAGAKQQKDEMTSVTKTDEELNIAAIFKPYLASGFHAWSVSCCSYCHGVMWNDMRSPKTVPQRKYKITMPHKTRCLFVCLTVKSRK